MNFADKKVLIIGIARSGIAVAKFLKGKGADITLTDVKTKAQLGDIIEQLEEKGFNLILGKQPFISTETYSYIIVSPGVPLSIEPIQRALEEEIPVVSEIELAYQFANAPIVAITGTNGKTTTTSLLGETFEKAKFRTLVAGNIGLPLVDKIEEYGKKDIIVAEVSSFQLEAINEFSPRVSIILNVTPDHLDRHGTIEEYTGIKANIFKNQSSGDFTVLNYDDPLVRPLVKDAKGSVIFFSQQHTLEEGVYASEGKIWAIKEGQKQEVCLVKDLKIPGKHNLENALAATAAAWVLEVDIRIIAETLKTFSGVSHRLEFVDEINGIKFINDSKGTNPNASIKALEAYEEPIILIAGGKNKGSNFAELADKIKDNVKELVLIGESTPLIKDAVEKIGYDKIYEAKDYPEAIKKAYEVAKSGDVVLLSPACASWDMFNSYEERGDLFKEVVKDLRG